MGNSKTITAKEYLYQLWNLDREIEIKYRELEKLKSQVGIKARPDSGDDVVYSGGTSDPVFDYVAKVIKLENQLDKKIDRLINLKARITKQIDGMESRTFRNILTCRYVLMENWDQVAKDCGYERRQCIRLHGKALQDFERKYLRCH